MQMWDFYTYLKGFFGNFGQNGTKERKVLIRMDHIIKQLPKLAGDKENENKKFFAKLRNKPPRIWII